MKGKQIAVLVLTALLLCGCTTNAEKPENENEARDEEKIEIGMTFDTFVIERWQRDRDIFVSTAKELGAQVNVQNANGDTNEQIKQIEYFIEKKVDVIVVVPIEAESLIDVIKEAHEKGIKVLCYDRIARNADADAYISFDNEAVGKLMAAALSSELTVGDKVLMVSGPKSDANVDSVNLGFEEEMKKDGIEIVDIAYMEDWKAELAYEYITANISMVENEVDGIMCGNDNLASQVIYALSENRLAGKIPVTGQDADLDACQRIVEGTQFMTVYKPVGNLAERAAEIAVKMANNEEIEYEASINDGTYDIPFIRLTPEAVTIETMNEVIVDSGFHLKEDIYMNRPDLLN